jgi:nucleoside-diphosphate-sugar epimerase
MIGNGTNRKSMAYVENVAAFLEHRVYGPPGVETWNYVDGPDLTMNELVSTVRCLMSRSAGVRVRIPYAAGIAVGAAADLLARLTRRSFTVSAVRVRKFCAETSFSSAASTTGFVSPVPLAAAIRRTVQHEFLETHLDEEVFASE